MKWWWQWSSGGLWGDWDVWADGGCDTSGASGGPQGTVGSDDSGRADDDNDGNVAAVDGGGSGDGVGMIEVALSVIMVVVVMV